MCCNGVTPVGRPELCNSWCYGPLLFREWFISCYDDKSTASVMQPRNESDRTVRVMYTA
jgi:hypothetical protein